MKKLLGIVVLGLLWCNVGYSEILKFDCNFYSGWKVDELKTNLRIIDTEKNTYGIVLVGHNNKKESYELPIMEFIGVPSRETGVAKISLNNNDVDYMFAWKVLGQDHTKGTEYEGFFQGNISSCYLELIPIDMSLYRALYSPYVLGNCENFNRDGEDVFHYCLATFQQAEINIQKHKEGKCRNVREKIAQSNARATSNAGNFLLGVMEGMWEDLAC